MTAKATRPAKRLTSRKNIQKWKKKVDFFFYFPFTLYYFFLIGHSIKIHFQRCWHNTKKVSRLPRSKGVPQTFRTNAPWAPSGLNCNLAMETRTLSAGNLMLYQSFRLRFKWMLNICCLIVFLFCFVLVFIFVFFFNHDCLLYGLDLEKKIALIYSCWILKEEEKHHTDTG